MADGAEFLGLVMEASVELNEALRQAKAQMCERIALLLIEYDPRLSSLINQMALDIMANDAGALAMTIRLIARHVEKEGEHGR